MKLSLTWIFDHIATSWKDHDILDLINRFNTTTAEIEGHEFISIDCALFTLVVIKAVDADSVIGFSAEFNREMSLALRPDLKVGQTFLVKKDKNQWKWAQGTDFFSSKEGLLPELYVPEQDCAGGWKETFENEDYILTIGNTSITHRPDLWCHRGFAREMAAILNCPLRDEKHFLSDYPINYSNLPEYNDSKKGFTLARFTEKCKRIAGLYIPEVSYTPSLLPMAHRLLRVDSRPINALVDTTNYVMFDIGQPMHAFDAKKISAKKLIVTQAQAEQSLTLLDGQTIVLSEDAIIMSDGKKPLGLAGIMGGVESSVTHQTSSLFIEAANFDAASIRSISHYFKLRTESSTRFEKSLDPMNVTTALLRYMHILEKSKIEFKPHGEIICLGDEVKHHTLELAHAFIEKKLGIEIPHSFVLTTLNALGFTIGMVQKQDITYHITVPSWRTKDVKIAEDVVEEVGRFYGFDKIPYELPSLVMKPSDISTVQKKYAVKQFLAYSARAHEVYNYALYDEEFLNTMQWHPQHALKLKNPISEHMVHLVTSLVPNLFKNICTNKAQEDVLNFFEWNKIWPAEPVQEKLDFVREHSSLAGIFFNEKKAINFYEYKHILSSMFTVLDLTVEWVKADKELLPWYHPYKTVQLMYRGIVIGIAGCVNPGFIAPFLTGDAFIFEINSDLLLEQHPQQRHFAALPKYPDTWRDISMLVPLSVTVQQLSDLILKVTPTIFKVELIDFFQKEEWGDQRSVTMRFFARDPNKTLLSNEIDSLYDHVLEAVVAIGAQVR